MTTTPIPIYSQTETFYVPRFEIYVQGEKLKANVVDDILQVTYKDKINTIDTFTIEINNWDADKRTFKFAPPQKGYEGIFDPGQKIEIRMGYYKNIRKMMHGVITELQPNFPESGASTLSVSGLNELHRFRTEKHTYSWTDGTKTDTDIAEELCGDPVQKGQPGLGLAIHTNPSQDEQPFELVYMKSQYDIDFLEQLAHRHGYEIYLEDETDKPTLFFGLPDNPGTPTYQLEWGKSLISFRPNLNTSKQVNKVVVRAWDRRANKAIEEEYTLQQLWKDENKSQAEIARLSAIAKTYQNRTEVVTKEPMRTRAQAKSRAKAVLIKKNNELLVATATTIGLPDLRSGCSVQILGLGVPNDSAGTSRGASCDFNGEYFVEESTHTISGNGYRTEFSARWKKVAT
jgi:phage protein D